MNDLLKIIIGARDPPVGEKCAWRYYAEEHIENNVDVPDRHADCEYCNGYPKKSCANYTTLSHLEHFYDIFRASKRAN